MRRAMIFLGISLALSVIAAIEFTAINTWTLPKNDLAHGQSPFADPLVLPVMLRTALTVGVLTWPIATLLAWPTSITKTTITTGVVILGFIVVATPIRPAYGLVGSIIVGIATLAYIRISYERQRKAKIPANKAL